MNTTLNKESETERIAVARESFSGRLLTDTQFDEIIAHTRIVEAEIHRSGTFKDCLGDYAYTYAKRYKANPERAEHIIRDLYRERVGETMNQTRERLMKREEALTEGDRAMGYEHAVRIGERVEHGDKIAFSRGYAAEAGAMAGNLGITHVAARKIMAEEFEAAENLPLRDWGKELDVQHFQPQIEAEKQERARSRETGRGQARTGSSRRHDKSGANGDQQTVAKEGWDHAAEVTNAGERPARASVPRTRPRPQSRINRVPSGPTRSGP